VRNVYFAVFYIPFVQNLHVHAELYENDSTDQLTYIAAPLAGASLRASAAAGALHVAVPTRAPAAAATSFAFCSRRFRASGSDRVSAFVCLRFRYLPLCARRREPLPGVLVVVIVVRGHSHEPQRRDRPR